MLEFQADMSTADFVLASASPRRRQLLSLLGLSFSTSPANIDEQPLAGETPLDYVKRIALQKNAACRSEGARWILTADTTVDLNGEILGKPLDAQDARRMLLAMRGKPHQGHTAIVLREAAVGRFWTDECTTTVWMREYPEEELAAYLASGDQRDKAGAYAIQNGDFHPAAEVQGCYANVMGLPLCHLWRLIEQAGLELTAGIAARCQNELLIDCPVYSQILPAETAAETSIS